MVLSPQHEGTRGHFRLVEIRAPLRRRPANNETFRRHSMKTFPMTLAVAALLIGSVSVMALTIPGGGPAKSDCYNGFEVSTDNSVCPLVTPSIAGRAHMSFFR
jgi:hypothetical protein